MGGKCPHRKVKKRRFSHKSARRAKFLLKGDDAVYDELRKVGEEAGGHPRLCLLTKTFQGWANSTVCIASEATARYFANSTVRDDHFRTKRHRKRVKQMMGPAPHTQLDADLAAGMGMPDNGPKLMSM